MTIYEAVEKYKLNEPKMFITIPRRKVYLLDNENKVLFDLGRNTTEAEYQVRADTVLKWWGLWGLMWFKMGYEKRGK